MPAKAEFQLSRWLLVTGKSRLTNELFQTVERELKGG
jgi:hypothetical protein